MDEAPAGRALWGLSVQFAVERWASVLLGHRLSDVAGSWATRRLLTRIYAPRRSCTDPSRRSRTRDVPSPPRVPPSPLPGSLPPARHALKPRRPFSGSRSGEAYETGEVRWQGNLGLLSWAASPALTGPRAGPLRLPALRDHRVLHPDRPQHSSGLTTPVCVTGRQVPRLTVTDASTPALRG